MKKDDLDGQWEGRINQIKKERRRRKPTKRLVAKAERVASDVRKRAHDKQVIVQADDRSVWQRTFYRNSLTCDCQ